MKQSNADMGQLVEVVRLVGSDFAVLTGIDSQSYPALCIGGVGIFSTAASVVPRQMVDLYNAFVDGRQDEARELHMILQELNRFLEYDPGYVAPCKEALALLGLPAGPVRKPLPELSDAEREGIRQALSGWTCSNGAQSEASSPEGLSARRHAWPGPWYPRIVGACRRWCR